eukprot:Opistho-2@54516
MALAHGASAVRAARATVGGRRVLATALLVLLLADSTHALLEGLYCGVKNCYDVIGVQPNAEKAEIKRAYRKLSFKLHPDRNKSPDANAQFRELATAYEILKDDDARADYDQMLQHPEQYYRHYFKYYQRRVTPKVDPKIVIAVLLVFVSIFQYANQYVMHRRFINYILRTPKMRAEALQEAEAMGHVPDLKAVAKRERADEESKFIESMIPHVFGIDGSYAQPSIRNVLAVRTLVLPYTIAMYVAWYARWIYKFNIKGHPLGLEETEYLTRRTLGLSEHKWKCVPEETKAEMLSRRLYLPGHLEAYKKEQEETMKERLANSARYKQYRRFMKKQ